MKGLQELQLAALSADRARGIPQSQGVVCPSCGAKQQLSPVLRSGVSNLYAPQALEFPGSRVTIALGLHVIHVPILYPIMHCG